LRSKDRSIKYTPQIAMRKSIVNHSAKCNLCLSVIDVLRGVDFITAKLPINTLNMISDFFKSKVLELWA